MERQNRSLFQRMIAAAVIAGMLASLAACAKPPAETAAPKEPVTAETAITELHRQSEALGFDNALEELEEKNTATIGGDTYIRLQQHYEGIPVYGKTIVYAANEDGQMTSVTGNVQDLDPDIDLTPTITPAQAQESIRTYAAEVLGMEQAAALTLEELSWADACIYTQSGSPVLAYAVTIGADRAILDAHNGSILSWDSKLSFYNIQYTGPEGTNTIPGTDPISGRYILKDQERNIYVYDAQGNAYYYDKKTHPDAISLVTSSNTIFGDDDDNTATSELGYIYLDTLGKVHDFFLETVGDSGPEVFIAVYNDLYHNPDASDQSKHEKNGGGGYGDLSTDLPEMLPDTEVPLSDLIGGMMIMSTGYNDELGTIYDVIGHEYQHIIFAKQIGDGSSALEFAVINEGIADIMGELFQASQEEADWVNDCRDMRDPRSRGHAAAVGDRNDSTADDVHAYSTIISHSAYLMWNGIDGTESKRLSEQQLAELWYRAVLMMPSDCDFILCRQLVEVAAQSMENLTDEQRACVREAFDRVGISTVSEDTEADYQLDVNGTLSVYDENRAYYSGYTLSINGNPMRLPVGDRKPEIGFYYNKTVKVDSAEPYQIDLPAGLYRFKISDAYSPVTYSFSVQVGPGYASNIDLITAYEEPLVVVVPEQKQLTRIDTYDESGSLINYRTYTYFDSGFLHEVVSRDIDQGQCVFELQTTYTYNESNKFRSRITVNPEYPDESSGKEYTYDKQGRMIRSEAWEGGGVETTYEYDAQDRVIRTTELFESGSSVTEHIYDDSGRLIRDVTTTYEDWSEDTWTDTTVYTYDAEGRLSTVEMEGSFQTLTEVYDYSYLPFVVVDHCYNGGDHIYYLMLPDGSPEMLTVLSFDDPEFYTDEDGYLAKVIDQSDYWGNCVYEFYYQDEIAKSVNGPFRIGSGEASQIHTPDEAEALLYDYLVQIYGSEGLSLSQTDPVSNNEVRLQMTISDEGGGPIYVIEWYRVDLRTGVVTMEGSSGDVCDLW